MRENAMSVQIRPATLSDIDTLVKLLRQLFGIEGDFGFDADTHRRGLKQLLGRHDDAWIWVAAMDGDVVGMCTGQKMISTAAGGPSLQIEDMVIDEAHRGNGIGAALFSHIERWAAVNGFVRMQLNADSNNAPALAFYDSQGWEQCNLVWLRKHIESVRSGYDE